MGAKIITSDPTGLPQCCGSLEGRVNTTAIHPVRCSPVTSGVCKGEFCAKWIWKVKKASKDL